MMTKIFLDTERRNKAFELASSRQNQGGRKQILYGGTTKKIEF